MDEIELKKALDVLKQTPDRFNFVCAIIEHDFKIKDAVSAIGRSKSWFYELSQEERDYLMMIASEYNAAVKMRALKILEDAIPQAAEVKVAGLKSRDERVKQSAASEILDRGIGKVTTPYDLNVRGPIVINWDEIDNADNS